MNLRERLEILLRPGVELVQLEPGIFSVFRPGVSAKYDRKAKMYDRIVGSWFYNRLMWGTTPKAYARFAADLHANRPRVVLDAGCGSMLATAEAHTQSDAFVVGIDMSLDMLRKAKIRLDSMGATNVVLLQADLLDLPFRTGAFEAGLFMGMLHLFPDAGPVLDSIKRVMQPQAKIQLTSLAKVGRFLGDRYYDALRRVGEVGPGKSQSEILRQIESKYSGVNIRREGNMVFATTFR